MKRIMIPLVCFALGVAAWADSTLPNTYYLPEIQNGDGNETYVAIVNPNDGAATVEVFGFGADGTEYGMSSVVGMLGAGARAWFSVSEAFGENAANVAWVQVGGSDSLEVFAEIWNEGNKSAYWATGLGEGAFMPHVAKNTATFSTTYSSVNGTSDGIQTALRPKPSGSPKVVSEHGTGFGKAKHDILDYYDDLSSIDWIEIESNARASAHMEFFNYIDGRNRMAALGLDDNRAQTLHFLHIATDTVNFWTGMVYINVGDADAAVTETFYDATGAVLKTVMRTLAPNEKITLLFDANTQVDVPPGSAWLKVEADQNLVGYELFGGTTNDFFSALQGNYTSNEILDYPYYQAAADRWVGYVALNLGDATADITFHAFDANGTELATTTVTGVGPNQKVTRVGADLFPGVDNIAWVRSTTTGSSWAGFLLWGDQGSDPRVNLSALVAKQRAAFTAPGTQIVQEVEDNNSYETAQVLTPGPDGFNINVVGNVAQSDAGGVVNDYGAGSDDIEDIFKFTIDAPTPLVIGVAPELQATDIDFFVVKGELADQNFFVDDPTLDPLVDFSAGALGFENVAKVFEPGTYYIFVSLFEGDTVPATDYGMILTSFPVAFDTFDDPSVPGWTFGTFTDDADSAAAWEHSTGFVGVTENGAALAQVATTGIGIESSVAISPLFDVPATGLTLIDVDVATIYDGATADEIYQWNFLALLVDQDGNIEQLNGWSWADTATATSITYAGANAFWITYSAYINVMMSLGSTFDYSLVGLEGGSTSVGLYPALIGEVGGENQVVAGDVITIHDNFRAMNFITTMSKRSNNDGRVIFGGGGVKPQLKHFKLVNKAMLK